jgi:hypothetical protein
MTYNFQWFRLLLEDFDQGVYDYGYGDGSQQRQEDVAHQPPGQLLAEETR